MKTFHKDSKPGAWKGGKKFGGGGNFRDRGADSRGFERPTLHKATCSQCGKPCEVPFKPNGSKPILCSACFKREGGPEKHFSDKRAYKPDFQREERRSPDDVSAQLKAISAKLDAIMEALSD